MYNTNEVQESDMEDKCKIMNSKIKKMKIILLQLEKLYYYSHISCNNHI